MSPTSYLLLYPAMYILKSIMYWFCFFFFNSKLSRYPVLSVVEGYLLYPALWTAKIQRKLHSAKVLQNLLFKAFSHKIGQFVVCEFDDKFDWITTNLTILYIGLGNGRIQQNRNLGPTVGTLEKMYFHYFNFKSGASSQSIPFHG